ncbi:MAG: hypothetical protein ACFFCO_10365, partial [Promethearchaeota archaeon]
GDNELAQKIDDIRKCERHLATESCRKELLEAVRVHLLHLDLAKYKPCSAERTDKLRTKVGKTLR